LATRAASIAARSGCEAMSRAQDLPSQPAHFSAVCDRPQRPPNVIGRIPPSSSGMATIIVASTGSRPRASASHDARVWNSTGWQATYGTSSDARISSAARLSL
jgi:hypothetical protein